MEFFLTKYKYECFSWCLSFYTGLLGEYINCENFFPEIKEKTSKAEYIVLEEMHVLGCYHLSRKIFIYLFTLLFFNLPSIGQVEKLKCNKNIVRNEGENWVHNKTILYRLLHLLNSHISDCIIFDCFTLLCERIGPLAKADFLWLNMNC